MTTPKDVPVLGPPGAPMQHYVSTAAFDPNVGSQIEGAGGDLLATPFQIMWWRFTRHRLAVASGIFLCLMLWDMIRDPY